MKYLSIVWTLSSFSVTRISPKLFFSHRTQFSAWQCTKGGRHRWKHSCDPNLRSLVLQSILHPFRRWLKHGYVVFRNRYRGLWGGYTQNALNPSKMMPSFRSMIQTKNSTKNYFIGLHETNKVTLNRQWSMCREFVSRTGQVFVWSTKAYIVSEWLCACGLIVWRIKYWSPLEIIHVSPRNYLIQILLQLILEIKRVTMCFSKIYEVTFKTWR